MKFFDGCISFLHELATDALNFSQVWIIKSGCTIYHYKASRVVVFGESWCRQVVFRCGDDIEKVCNYLTT